MRAIARSLIGAIAIWVAAVGLCAAGAWAADKIARIGYLSGGYDRDNYLPNFLQGLRDFGYDEGRNIVIEYRFAAGNPDRLPELASELVHAGVDLIVAAGGTPPTVAAMQATRTIPIVFPVIGRPVEKGIVASLAHPGGNVTGFAQFSEFSKNLQLLKEAVPEINRVAFIYGPAALSEAYNEAILRKLADDARALGIAVQPIALRAPDDTELVFQAMAAGTNGLLIQDSQVAMLAGHQICALAAEHRLPAISHPRDFADAGCLMTYGDDQFDLFRRAAGYVDKILKGARPGDLPVEQPTKFDLVVNLKTAHSLGIDLPPAILVRATEVIE